MTSREWPVFSKSAPKPFSRIISTRSAHPDPPGNFTDGKGPPWEQARAGRMDAQFKVIIPPTYADNRYLDEKGCYILHVGRSNRGDLHGRGHTGGKVRIDTMFEPMVRKRATGPCDRGQGGMENDTFPFLVFEDALSGKKGLWHRQAGQLRAAASDRFEGASPVTSIRKKGDTAFLFPINGRPLAGPCYRIHPEVVDGCLVVRPTRQDEYILPDPEGRFLRKLESEPRRLADDMYVMARYEDGRSSQRRLRNSASATATGTPSPTSCSTRSRTPWADSTSGKR